MPKKFFAEDDIEDLVKKGILTLEVDESVVLTDLAYEKAASLGVKLIHTAEIQPPAAPIRPYLSQVSPSAATQSQPCCSSIGEGCELHQRIKSAVKARLGDQVDAALLDVIIHRVLQNTGVK
jgi:hypothetical protein